MARTVCQVREVAWPDARGTLLPVKRLSILALLVAFAGRLCAGETIWLLDNMAKIGGHPLTVEGSPVVRIEAGAAAIWFDGVKDGLWLRDIPFSGQSQFTIEILFQPAADGPAEQRFFHSEDTQGRRALIETRLDGKGGWWLDTFIVTPAAGPGVTLVDPSRVHPTGHWYWAALRYDGKTMAHFVNGRKEREERVAFEKFGPGQTSLGVRQNRVHWFKGAIREVRFHFGPVADDELQRVR